jgi:hypothetical protein
MMQSTALNHPIRKTHIEPIIAEFQNLIPVLQDESTKLESAVKLIRKGIESSSDDAKVKGTRSLPRVVRCSIRSTWQVQLPRSSDMMHP